jgi:hypothetical protein
MPPPPVSTSTVALPVSTTTAPPPVEMLRGPPAAPTWMLPPPVETARLERTEPTSTFPPPLEAAAGPPRPSRRRLPPPVSAARLPFRLEADRLPPPVSSLTCAVSEGTSRTNSAEALRGQSPRQSPMITAVSPWRLAVTRKLSRRRRADSSEPAFTFMWKLKLMPWAPPCTRTLPMSVLTLRLRAAGRDPVISSTQPPPSR